MLYKVILNSELVCCPSINYDKIMRMHQSIPSLCSSPHCSYAIFVSEAFGELKTKGMLHQLTAYLESCQVSIYAPVTESITRRPVPSVREGLIDISL